MKRIIISLSDKYIITAFFILVFIILNCIGDNIVKTIKQMVFDLHFKNISIKNKLVLSYSILILIFVTTLSISSYLSSTKIISEKSVNYTIGILEQIRNNIDINLEQIDLATYLIFSNPDILSILKNSSEYFNASNASEKFYIDKLMADVVFSRRDIYSITVFDNKGARIDTNFYNPDVPFAEVTRKSIEKDGKMAWLNTDRKVSVIPAVRQIRDMDMRPVGFMEINIKENSIKKICSDQIRQMEGQIYVVNEDGIIISGNDSTYVNKKVDSNILERMKQDKPGYMVDTINNKKSIIAFYPSRINDWQYIGIIPMKNVTEDAAVVRNVTIISSLAAIILFIIVSYYLAKGLTGPLNLIAGQMKLANIKDWSPQINYEGRDEIAYLTEEFNQMVVRINNLVDEVVEQKSRQSRQELRALQSQINPHFLYNTLEIVNWMARTRDVPEIAEIVKALSDMMRYITSHKEEIVTVEKEIEYIKMYCLIQMNRYRDKFTVEYEIEEDVLDYSIPKLTLQPIIENAIIHAFNGVKRDGRIQVTGCVIDSRLRLQIIDNGRGIEQCEIERMLNSESHSSDCNHAGIGVNNVNRRIKLIYGSEYGLEIKSAPNEGSVFNIWLPVKYQEEVDNNV